VLAVEKNGGAVAQGTLVIAASRAKTLSLTLTTSGRKFFASLTSRPVAGKLTIKLVGGEMRTYRLTLRPAD
jgi:hypothetical protein